MKNYSQLKKFTSFFTFFLYIPTMLKYSIILTLCLVLLKTTNIIDISYLTCNIPFIVIPVFYMIMILTKQINNPLELNEELLQLAKSISEKLIQSGYNIKTNHGYVNKDKKFISYGYYFDYEWDSGVRLEFEVNDDTLKLSKQTPFGFRHKKYDTPENKELVQKLISEIENTKLK